MGNCNGTHNKFIPLLPIAASNHFALIYSGKKQRWKVCGSRFNEKRPSVQPRLLMSSTGQRSSLRLFTVTLGRVLKLSQALLSYHRMVLTVIDVTGRGSSIAAGPT